MDRMIYTAMTGAKHILNKQATTAHNLANATSTGFKSQIDAFRAVPVVGKGLPTRAFVVDATAGSDFNSGAIQSTNRDLDVAIHGEGWLTVQRADGTEAYTRNGSLKVSENGILQTATGLTVMGDGGPISIPPDIRISIGKDGTVSSVENNTLPGPANTIGRLKLVNPNEKDIVRADDGLFVTKDGNPAVADANVSVINGALESSNVNVVDAMVTMIGLARQFETQMKLISTAQNNDEKAGQLLALR
ncbi:MAG: flagellar biosynthesis protein FlgF [Betaproteobacteria bacterium HGW-Betaproteobacteria-22]|nr:MAG: flagellar biosynthesis protein FlgF [Betaproteobacteria bacterium HGW-Betaproteobacteria-22]